MTGSVLLLVVVLWISALGGAFLPGPGASVSDRGVDLAAQHGSSAASPYVSPARPDRSPRTTVGGPDPAVHPVPTTLPLVAPATTPATPIVDAFYYQQAFIVTQVDGSPSTSFTTVTETFTVAASPYDTGYELNALTNAGDWVQFFVTDSWPYTDVGCDNVQHGTIQYGYEIWNSAGSSVADDCFNSFSSGVAPDVGDVVTLQISLADYSDEECESAGAICLTVVDQTHPADSGTTAMPLPDSGATGFTNGFGGTAATSGEFTGPMTEVIDLTATSCEAYGSLPMITYNFTGTTGSGTSAFTPAAVGGYEPFADDFELDQVTGNRVVCGRTSFGSELVSDSPWAQFFSEDIAGDQIEAAQNETAACDVTGGCPLVNVFTDFETSSVSLAVSGLSTSVSGSVTVGEEVTYSASIEGGSSPWSCGLLVNGASSAGLSGTDSPGCAGTYSFPLNDEYTIAAFARDANGNFAVSSSVGFTVNYTVPRQAPPVPSRPSADVYQGVTFTASVSGGSGGGTYSWSANSALGCVDAPYTTGPTLTCVPASPLRCLAGLLELCSEPPVSYQYVDSVGQSATGSTGLWTFVVYADPTLSPPTPSAASVDAGQAVSFAANVDGGSGPGVYAWTEFFPLTMPCVGFTSPTLTCFPYAAGLHYVEFTFVDSNGVYGTGTTILRYDVATDPVNFTETGLPAKTLAKDGWTVVLNGVLAWSSTATISLSVYSTGTYPLVVTGPSGYRTGAGGTQTVTGPTDVAVTFAKGKSAALTLTFRESGLPSTGRKTVQSWCVALDGYAECSTTASLKFRTLAPTSYAFAVQSPLAGQNLTQKVGSTVTYGPDGEIALTRSATVHLTFAYRYAVTFTESGLTGGSWSVTVHGVTETKPYDDPIVFNETNGTYGYKVAGIAGYANSGVPSKVTVSGGPASVAVTFTPKR